MSLHIKMVLNNSWLLLTRTFHSKILCPCRKCKNRINQSRDEVRTHLRCDGIFKGYTTWVHHGEDYEGPTIEFVDVPNISRNLANSGSAQDGQDGI